MVNTKILKEKIKDKGLKLKYVAGELGIHPYSLTLKLSGKRDFLQKEANTLADILDLTNDEKLNIFFN